MPNTPERARIWEGGRIVARGYWVKVASKVTLAALGLQEFQYNLATHSEFLVLLEISEATMRSRFGGPRCQNRLVSNAATAGYHKRN